MGLLLWCYLTNRVVPRPTSLPPVAFFTLIATASLLRNRKLNLPP